MSAHVIRPTCLMLSATLAAMAGGVPSTGQPLPLVSANGDLVSVGATNMSSGDLNGDGYMDVVVGNVIYWGSSSGLWGRTGSPSSYTVVTDPVSGGDPVAKMWIVPNITGTLINGFPCSELIAVDQYGHGGVYRWDTTASPQSIVGFSTVAPGIIDQLKGEPTVGDFNKDGKKDIAWLTASAEIYVAINSGTDLVTSPAQPLQGSTLYSAISAIPTAGGADLIVVRSYGGTTDVVRYPGGSGFNASSWPTLQSVISISSPNLTNPLITVGDIDGNGDADLAITSIGSGFTALVGNAAASSPEVINPAYGLGWIIADATGDQKDDFSWGPSGGQGLIHGRPGFFANVDLTSYPVDRTIPVDEFSVPTRYVLSNGGGGTVDLVRPMTIKVFEDSVATPAANVGVAKILNLSFSVGSSSAGSVFLLPPLTPNFLSSSLEAWFYNPVSEYSYLPNEDVTLDPSEIFAWGVASSPISILEIAGEIEPEDNETWSFTRPAMVSEPTIGTSTRSGAVFKTFTFDTSMVSAAEVKNLLASIQYKNSSAKPTNGIRRVEVTSKGKIQNSDAGDIYGGTSVLARVLVEVDIADFAVQAGETGVKSDFRSAFTVRGIGDYDTVSLVSTPTKGTAVYDPGANTLTYTAEANARGTEDLVFLVEPLSESAPVAGGSAPAIRLSGGSFYVTLRVTIGAQQLALLAPGRTGTSASLGESIRLVVADGTPPYRITASGGSVVAGPLVTSGVDLDEDGQTNDPGKVLLFTPTQAGEVGVAVTDADGTARSLTFTTTALPVTTLVAPTVPASTGSTTVFGSICPGTTAGVASLRAAFPANADTTKKRGFTWNAIDQTYRELPAEAEGGLLPTDGVFLAARVNLGLDFNGSPLPAGTSILLQPSWNFVGLGPVQLTGGQVVRTHDLASDFTVTDLNGAELATTSITQAYLWDGDSYNAGSVLTGGVGYWIKNVSGAQILLKRKDSDADTKAVRVARFAQAGEPPAPPSSTQATNNDGAAGCGSGSGIAVLLAGLAAFLKLRLRRP